MIVQFVSRILVLCFRYFFLPVRSPRGLTFTWWGCWGLCFWHKPTELAHSFLFCSCVYFCLYDPFNCISFHKFSRQLSVFSLCSSGLIFALLVLSTIYLFMKVSFSSDVILCGWLGLKYRLTNEPPVWTSRASSEALVPPLLLQHFYINPHARSSPHRSQAARSPL